MDLVFTCPNCRQELEVDSSGAGTEIDCPECGLAITIPDPTPQNIRATPISATAAGHQERHFSVPTSKRPIQVKIEKPRQPLEAAAKEGEKQLCVKCIRHHECVEGGRDRFDESVALILRSVGENNLVRISPIHYSFVDKASGNLLTDYGVLIVYRG